MTIEKKISHCLPVEGRVCDAELPRQDGEVGGHVAKAPDGGGKGLGGPNGTLAFISDEIHLPHTHRGSDRGGQDKTRGSRGFPGGVSVQGESRGENVRPLLHPGR